MKDNDSWLMCDDQKVLMSTFAYNILKLDSLAGCPVTASPHNTLNCVKGVIKCKELLDSEKSEILHDLQEQGVVDIFNIKATQHEHLKYS